MPANKNNPDKIQEIFDYLMIEFPDSLLSHEFDGRRRVETFFLKFKNQQFLISFSSEFLKDTLVDEIQAKLKYYNLISAIRQGKASHVIVTNSGLEIDTH